MTRMLTLLRLAAEAIIVIVDARDLGARVGQPPGVDVAAHLAHAADADLASNRSGHNAT